MCVLKVHTIQFDNSGCHMHSTSINVRNSSENLKHKKNGIQVVFIISIGIRSHWNRIDSLKGGKPAWMQILN